MAHDVFLSHSSKDKTTADAVCAMLEARGIRCWVAPRDIVPGADWGESIVEAIGSSKVMVLVFSQHANESVQIKREIERAVSKGLVIVPFRIEEVVPTKALEYFLSTPHWLDAYTPPLDQHLGYLADTVANIMSGGGAELKPPKLAPRRVPWYRQRVALIAVPFVLLLGFLLFRPHPPGDVVKGSWKLSALKQKPESFASITHFPQLFYAALDAEETSGTLTVSGDGQANMTITVTDEGTVRTNGNQVHLVSSHGDARDDEEFFSGTSGLTAPERNRLRIGPDDPVLVLAGNFWVGRPGDGTTHPVIGKWHDPYRIPGGWAPTLSITKSGTYRLSFTRELEGPLTVTGRRFAFKTQQQTEEGTLRTKSGTIELIEASNTTTWKRK